MSFSLISRSVLRNTARFNSNPAAARQLLARGAGFHTARYGGLLNSSNTPVEKESFLQSTMGKTGSAVLGAAVVATAFSKELILIHPETLVVGLFGGVVYALYKKAAPGITASLDERGAAILESLSKSKDARVQALKEEIAEAKLSAEGIDAMGEVMEIAKEITRMETEVAYRESLSNVANHIKRNLNHIASLEMAQRHKEQMAIVDMIEKDIIEGFTAEADAQLIKSCIDELSAAKLA
eukprot:Nk52_evm1s2482 gene=Nk52_evmTU1s2482